MSNPTMGGDAAYAKTRRRGVTGTITRLTDTTADPLTGERTDTEVVTTIRWMVVEPTQYSRIMRAEAVQQKVGLTTITIWLKDVEDVFTSLDAEDFATVGGKRYEVVRTTVEDTSFVIFCNELAK